MYLPWFEFDKEWKSVRLEHLTSIHFEVRRPCSRSQQNKGHWHNDNPFARPFLTFSVFEFRSLRFYQTPITWLRSISAILPLFWHHNIANIPNFAAKTWEVVLRCHEIHDVFPRIWAYVVQNLLIFHYLTMTLNIFSLNLTGYSVFFLNIY